MQILTKEKKKVAPMGNWNI